MKKYLKLVLFPITSILLLSIIMTIFNLFYISINKTIITILMILITFISGFILGRNVSSKGYLKGLLYGVIFAASMFILSLLLLSEHSLYNVIYYMIIIASTTLGSMFGIQKSTK